MPAGLEARGIFAMETTQTATDLKRMLGIENLTEQTAKRENHQDRRSKKLRTPCGPEKAQCLGAV